jgi:O-succinylhomoserine sulfhydrylase
VSLNWLKKYIYFPDLRDLITFNAWFYQKFRDFSDSFRQALWKRFESGWVLEQHPNVNRVKYPFLKSHPQYEVAQNKWKGGNVVAFEIIGGIEAGRNF